MRKMSMTSVQVLSPWHILPAKSLPCMLSAAGASWVVPCPSEPAARALAKLWAACFGSLAEMWSKALKHRALVLPAACINPGMLGLFLFNVWPVFGVVYGLEFIFFFQFYYIAHWRRKFLLLFFLKKQKHNYSEMNTSYTQINNVNPTHWSFWDI